MADSEAKKLLGNLWSSAGDRTDPDDATLTPTLTRTEGYPSGFSADMGDTPRRRVMNQRFREWDGAAQGAMTYGIELWDDEVDYPQNALTNSAGRIYRATVATGPDTSNATDPATSGQTVWTEVSGTTGAPSAPAAPSAVAPTSGELDWFWDCPLDNGAKVTSFNFRYRVAGLSAWSPNATGDSVTTARYALTGLANGTAIEAQVQAVNSVGTSPWSSTGSATPSGTVPEGGAQLALRAEAGDAEADLDWLEPDDGGVAITSYTVQWREDGQNFGTGRQATSTDNEHTVTGLTNDTLYHFRVRAVNGEGNGAWSNEASATPEAVVVPPTPPADTAPGAPGTPEGTAREGLEVEWSFDIPGDDGGQSVESFDLQWRYVGETWADGTTLSGLTATCATVTLADATLGVEARARAVNSVGTGGWSGTGTVVQGDVGEANEVTDAWRSGRDYDHPVLAIGSNDVVYRSKQDSTGEDPVSDSAETYWEPLLGSAATRDTGTGASELPDTDDADGRYLRTPTTPAVTLSGSQTYDAIHTALAADLTGAAERVAFGSIVVGGTNAELVIGVRGGVANAVIISVVNGSTPASGYTIEIPSTGNVEIGGVSTPRTATATCAFTMFDAL